MRELVYIVNGMEIASYEEARRLQPTGQLKVKLNEIRTVIKTNPETLRKRQEYFAMRKAEKMRLAAK